MHLNYPLASVLSALTSDNLSIVERAAVEKNGDLQKTDGGTGPFMLSQWVPDNYMTLEKNPYYFRRGLPKVDEIVIRIIPDESSLLTGVRSHSLDMASVSDGSVVKQAQTVAGLQVVQVREPQPPHLLVQYHAPAVHRLAGA